MFMNTIDNRAKPKLIKKLRYIYVARMNLLITTTSPKNKRIYRSLVKKHLRSVKYPPTPIIASISKVYSKMCPPNWPRAESVQMQHDARLVLTHRKWCDVGTYLYNI